MKPEELFDKLIKNEISRAEFEDLLEGMDDDDIRARYEMYLQEQFQKELDDFMKNPSTNDDENAVLKVTKSYHESVPRQKMRFPMAAAIILIASLAFSVFFVLTQFNKPIGSGKGETMINPEIIEKSTPKGRKFRMTLEDGSFVHMNSASTITYPNRFENDHREIKLVGEAFFKIHRDETRPFTIDVKGYKVQVLGTSFNVQAYKDESDFSVTVASGTVRVTLDDSGKNSVILQKNQKLLFNPITKVSEVNEVISDEDISWRKGILKFNATPMPEVEKILERWYGIDLVIANKEIYKKNISGIHKNENLKSVIEALTFATGSSYRVKNNTIIIK